MRDGRTRAATTSRCATPISMPTPEPNASSLRTSAAMGMFAIEVFAGMPGSVAPGGVVPPQNVDLGIVSGGHVLHLRGHRAPEVRELTIRQHHLSRGAVVDNRIALKTKEGSARAE